MTRVPLSVLRNTSKTIRSNMRAKGGSTRDVIAATRGMNDTVRDRVAQGASTRDIVTGLKAYDRVLSGGRFPKFLSKPDMFIEDAYAQQDFLGEAAYARDAGYNLFSGFEAPKAPRGTVKNDLAPTRKKLAAKKAKHKRGTYNRTLSPEAARTVGGNYGSMSPSEYNFKGRK